MNRARTAITIVLLLLVCLACASAAELFPDGGMEGTLHWKGYSDGSATVPRAVEMTTTEKHGGKQSLHLEIYQGASEWPVVKGPAFPTGSGKAYRVRFWAKIPQGSARVGIRSGADSDWTMLHPGYLTARTWTSYDFICREKNGGANARLAVWSGGGLVEMFLDDVSVTEIDLSKEAVLAGWRKAFPKADYVCWEKTSPWDPLDALQVAPKSPRKLGRIKLAMGVNEYESASIVVTNLSDVDRKFSIGLGDSELALTLRQAMWITSHPGIEVNDALPLLDGPLNVPSGQSREVWLTVRSAGAKPGNHRVRISVTSPGLRGSSIELAAKVYPVTLPEDKPIYSYYWDEWVPEGRSPELNRAAMLDLKRHYANTVSTHPWAIPPINCDASGKLVTDYKNLDATLENYKTLNPKMILFWWGADIYLAKRTYPTGIAYMSDEWKALFRDWLTAWVQHMKENGYGYDRFAMYPSDETISPFVCDLVKLIKQVDPKILVYINNTGSTVEEVTNIAPYIDIWCPYLYDYLNNPPYHDRVDVKKVADKLLRKNPNYFWTYANPPANNPETAPPYKDYRLGPWRAWNAGMMGYGFWIYYYKSHWNNYKHPDGVNWSVAYPGDAPDTPESIKGKELIVPGKRWEATREGIEDFVYLWMLREAVSKSGPSADPAAISRGKDLLNTLPKRVLANDTNPKLADEAKESVLGVLAKLGARK